MAPQLPWREKSTSARARKSETAGAKLDGGSRVPMSGAGRQKGDIKTARWLIEDKITDGVSFRITYIMLAKTVREAIAAHRLPQWRITLCGTTYRMVREEDWVALEMSSK